MGTSPKLAKLSIIVISVSSHSSLRNCLESIFANENQDKIEIIVALNPTDNSPSDLINQYPKVRFLYLPGKAGIPILMAAAIAQSAGEIIALTDSSCLVDANWITSILKSHQSPFPVIGGAVEISQGLKPLDLAAYFCEYGQFMYPLKAGVVRALPGNNISFKRSALAIGRQYVENEFWKTHWCQKLQVEGIELISDPAVSVNYARHFRLVPFLVRRFYHGRCFAGMRANRLTILKRALYMIGSIYLPFIFLFRTIAAVLSKKRLLKELLLSFPFIVLAIVFWSLGETLGYLAGTGKSCNYIY